MIIPDGRRIVRSSDHGVEVLDVRTGKAIAAFDGSDATFSPDGHHLITASGNLARIWRLFESNQQEIDEGKRLVSRCLSGTERHVAFLDPEPPPGASRWRNGPTRRRSGKTGCASRAPTQTRRSPTRPNDSRGARRISDERGGSIISGSDSATLTPGALISPPRGNGCRSLRAEASRRTRSGRSVSSSKRSSATRLDRTHAARAFNALDPGGGRAELAQQEREEIAIIPPACQLQMSDDGIKAANHRNSYTGAAGMKEWARSWRAEGQVRRCADKREKEEVVNNAVHSGRHLLRDRRWSRRCGIAVADSQRALTMIAGHFGFAAGVKAAEQQTPLWALMLGTVWLDIVFVPLFLMGIETLEPVAGLTGGYGANIIHADYTHSLVGAAALSAAFGAAFVFRWGLRSGVVLALVSFSHWVLVLLCHKRPDASQAAARAPLMARTSCSTTNDRFDCEGSATDLKVVAMPAEQNRTWSSRG